MRANAFGVQSSVLRFLAVTVGALSLLLSGCGGSAARPGPAAAERSPLIASAQRELALTRDAIDDLARESHLALDASLGAQLGNVRRELEWLQRRAPRWQPSSSVEELVSALAQHRELLAELRQLPSTEAREPLSALLRDLEIKAQQCRRFGGPVPVSVSVVTRDAEQREVTGFEVWFVRKAYESKPAAFRRFDRHSSPAGRVFHEAGYYVLWAVPPGQGPLASSPFRPIRLDVEVGASEQEQVFDLSAPTPAAAASAAPSEPAAGAVGAWSGSP